MAARDRFDRWVRWAGGDAEAAKLLACDVSYPNKLRHSRRPGLDVAHKIERATSEVRSDGERWSEAPIRTEEWLDGDEVAA